MIRYVIEVGGQNYNLMFRYIGRVGIKNGRNLRYVIFGRPLSYKPHSSHPDCQRLLTIVRELNSVKES